MKTRRLTAILTSAYLSAMLATSVAPIRSDAALAATIDPSAAQKALQSAVHSIDTSGWLAASTDPSTTAPAVAIASVSNPPPKAEPVMTEELMARIIKLTRDSRDAGSSVTARICKVLDLCDGTKDMPLKIVTSDSTDGVHAFGLPLDPNSKDILIMVMHDTVVETYLTDKTGKLRAACVLENRIAHLITNEKAAEKFKKELSLFAGEAAGSLPPTGTVVTGNS